MGVEVVGMLRPAIAVILTLLLAVGCTPSSEEGESKPLSPTTLTVPVTSSPSVTTEAHASTTTSTELDRRTREVVFRLLAFENEALEGLSYTVLEARGWVACMHLDNAMRNDDSVEQSAWGLLIPPEPGSSQEAHEARALFDFASRPESLCDGHRPYVEEMLALFDERYPALADLPAPGYRYLWALNWLFVWNYWYRLGQLPTEFEPQLEMGLDVCGLMDSLVARNASAAEWREELDSYVVATLGEADDRSGSPMQTWEALGYAASRPESLCPEVEPHFEAVRSALW